MSGDSPTRRAERPGRAFVSGPTATVLVATAILFQGFACLAQTVPAQSPAAADKPATQTADKPSPPVAVPAPVPIKTEAQPDLGLTFKPGSDAPLPSVKPTVVATTPPPVIIPSNKPRPQAAAPASEGPVVVPTGAVVQGPAAARQATAASEPAAAQTAGKGKKGKGAPPPPPPPPSTTAAYVIGALDVLEIKVWNDTRLSGIFDVRPDGMITMNLIGEMKADGLTVPELTQVVKRKLAESVMNDDDPPVNIQVARINSKRYSILGGCLRSGEFPLVGNVSVLDALVNCGGFKEFANTKKIYVLRGTVKYPFNYKDAINGRRLEQNIYLQNGDRIIVPE